MPDPKREFASPYRTGNNPINKVDPDGGCENPPCSESGVGLSQSYVISLAMTPAETAPDRSFSDGVVSFVNSTIDWVKYQFTWEGYGESLLNVATLGMYGYGRAVEGVINTASYISEVGLNDLDYYAGYATPMLLTGALLRGAGRGGRVNQSARTWNQFQSMTAGQFASRAEAGIAWAAYKQANGIVTGVARSQVQKSLFLQNAAASGMYPKWMNQWLQKGKVPPGYHVDHIVPLSIGGKDTPLNMRLLDIDMHIRHHKHYSPWR